MEHQTGALSNPASAQPPGNSRFSKRNIARRRRAAFAILTLCVSFTFVFAIAEISLRLFDIKPPTATALSVFFKRDSHVGWIGEPHANCRFATLDFDVLVRHGADGFRIVEERKREPDATRHPMTPTSQRLRTTSNPRSQRNKPERYRHGRQPEEDLRPVVWVLGDSMTWGWGVNNGETFVDRLARLDPDRRYRNLGAPGYSTLQECLLLERLLEAETAPEHVLVVFCINDFMENVDVRDQDPPRPYWEVNGSQATLRNHPVPGVKGIRPHSWAKRHLRAYNLLHYSLITARNSLRNMRNRRPIGLPEPVSDEQLVAMKATYQRLKGACDRRRIAIEIVYLPFVQAGEVSTQLEQESAEFEIRVGVRSLTAEVGIPVVDLTQPFSKMRIEMRPDVPVRFDHDPHFTAWGHELIGLCLFRHLSQNQQRAMAN